MDTRPDTDLTEPTTALSIVNAWTMGDTRALYEHYFAAPDLDNGSRNAQKSQDWREQHLDHLQKLSIAVGRHVLHLAQTQGLAPAPHSQAVDHPFINAWRKAASGEVITGWEAVAIGRALTQPVSMKLVQANPKFISEDRPAPTVEEVHAFIHEKVLAGNFERHETEMLGGRCENSGLHLSLTVNGWAPSLDRFDHEKMRFYPLAEGDITAPSIQHATIPLPTGQLLIADWFGHEAFISITEEVLKDCPSINSAAGCQERTRRLAQELGIGSVFVGNSCPAIDSDDNGVRIGRMAEEAYMANENRKVVCTDLWWATMLDKQTLVDLLARTMPVDQARQEVDDLVAEPPNGISQVSLVPGEYHLYYAGDPEIFANQFDREGVDLSLFDEPMLVLNRTQIHPRPAPASKPKA